MTLQEAYRVLRRFEDWRGGGDWRKLIYWLSAAVLTASVTF